MLREILLSLSGIPSSIWTQVNQDNKNEDSLRQYVSPPEKAMLAELSHLSKLHIEIKDGVAAVVAQHFSPICRAVAASIANDHLLSFRRKVTDVEASILRNDAGYVGGYQIVPLSTIVTEFAPWTRKLEWLSNITTYITGKGSGKRPAECTSADLLQLLATHRRTGFSDIENIATALLVTAQTAWMKSVSSWVLYGQLPSFGSHDFLVQKHGSADIAGQFQIKQRFVPNFVSARCAESILAIGSALNHIHIQSQSNRTNELSHVNITAQLLPINLTHIKNLTYPLHPSRLESTMAAIDRSISSNALSQILPVQEVIQIARVIHAYLLLDRGEFAITLITTTDDRLKARNEVRSSLQPVRKLGRLDDLTIKNAELNTILSKTWSDLAALQSDNESEDGIFVAAKKYMRLKTVDNSGSGLQNGLIATLLPTPTVLQLEVPNNSPLNIFLSRSEIARYAEINAYLLSIRRTEMKLSSLWKMTSHRRCHPAPLAPPFSATPMGRRALSLRRKREELRTIQMRGHWSSISKMLFVINEFGAYLHGEIIYNSWHQFETWLVPSYTEQHNPNPSLMKQDDQGIPERAAAFSGTNSNQPETPQNTSSSEPKRDPRAMAHAHRAFLEALHASLLLGHEALRSTLTALFELTDHSVALFGRLQTVWQGLDLQEDDGVMDAFTDYAKDEKDVLSEMGRSRNELEALMQQFLSNLRSIEPDRGVDDLTNGMATTGMSNDDNGGFVPWRAKTVDRLIMKIDFLQTDKDKDTEDLELEDSI